MEWPYKFPDPDDEIARQCAETQRYPFAERLDRLLDLIASSQTLANGLGMAETHRQLKERSEAEWQRAHREAIDLYLRRRHRPGP